jgi:hypothetical protein
MEKDLTIKAQIEGEKDVILPPDVQDCCFCLNKRSISRQHAEEEETDFIGVISL